MGKITNMGRMVVKDSKTGETVELVLGELRLLSVGSKRFLTSRWTGR